MLTTLPMDTIQLLIFVIIIDIHINVVVSVPIFLNNRQYSCVWYDDRNEN